MNSMTEKAGLQRAMVGFAAALLVSPILAVAQGEVTATHDAPLYSAGAVLDIDCTFAFPEGGILQSLLWRPDLPDGWVLLSATGDSEPEVDPEGEAITFFGENLGESNPVRFTYQVSVPEGLTGAVTLGGTAEYQLEGMANPMPAEAPEAVLSDADAAHSLAGYRAGEVQTVSGAFAYPEGRQLQSLLWRPELPPGWILRGAAGEGAPLVDPEGGAILFYGELPNPVPFSYTVSVPAGTRGPQNLGGEAEFQLDGMFNPVTARAMPNPLTVNALYTLEVISAYGTAIPATGISTQLDQTLLTNRIADRVVAQGSRTLVCTGWTMTGNDPVTGSGAECILSLTNNARLAWVWVGPLITPAGTNPVVMDEDQSPREWVQPGLSATSTSEPAGHPAGSLAWRLKTAPQHGTATVSGIGPTPLINYQPAQDWSGIDAFTVEVADGLGGLDEAVVQVTVNAVNDAPVLPAIGNRVVDEEGLLTIEAAAADCDDPPEVLRYALNDEARAAGMAISSSGRITWQPTEAQGGMVVRATVTVEDGGGLLDAETFTVTVAEVNRPPVLAFIPDQRADEQSTLSFMVTASDADDPAQGLTFSLDSDSLAAGMRLDPATGAFSWTPAPGQAGEEGRSYQVSVTVTDNGMNPPAQADTQMFTILAADSRGLHSSAGYLAGRAATIECEFLWPSNRPLQSLLWKPLLPPGWALISVSGQGAPELNHEDGSIIFMEVSLSGHNPLRFRYMVSVPSGLTGPQTLEAEVEYQVSGMANPVRLPVNPTPLQLAELHVLEVVSSQNAADPPAGFYTNRHGAVLTNRVETPWAAGGKTFACAGWTLEGMDPASGTGSVVSMVVTQEGTLTWNWVSPLISPAGEVSVTLDEDGTPQPWVTPGITATDPLGVDALVWDLVEGPSNGAVSVWGSGASPSMVYTPAVDYHGTDSFRVRVRDGLGASDSIWVRVIVRPVNDAPIASPLRLRAVVGVPALFDLSGSMNDPDGDFLSVSLDPRLVDTREDGLLAFTPEASEAGTEVTLSYWVDDGTALPVEGLVMVTVVSLQDYLVENLVVTAFGQAGDGQWAIAFPAVLPPDPGVVRYVVEKAPEPMGPWTEAVCERVFHRDIEPDGCYGVMRGSVYVPGETRHFFKVRAVLQER